MDKWSENEVKHVAKNGFLFIQYYLFLLQIYIYILLLIGNSQINKIYERYVPHSLDKPDPAASMLERKNWIRAKYVNKDFMTPFTLKETLRDNNRVISFTL